MFVADLLTISYHENSNAGPCNTYRYIFCGMNIHLPAIYQLFWGSRHGTRVLTHPQISCWRSLVGRQDGRWKLVDLKQSQPGFKPTFSHDFIAVLGVSTILLMNKSPVIKLESQVFHG